MGTARMQRRIYSIAMRLFCLFLISIPASKNDAHAAAEHHKLALVLPMSGPHSTEGNSLKNSILMAMLDTNSTEFELRTYDSFNGADLATKKALDDGCEFIIGSIEDKEDVEIKDLINGRELIFISLNNNKNYASEVSTHPLANVIGL